MASRYISPRSVRRTLRFSVADGAAFAGMVGLTQSYITPFALALKATTAQIGLLTSIPNFTMALAQLAAPGLCEITGSRKRFILPVVFLHALMWIPILLIPYLVHQSPVAWLIGFVTLNMVLGSIANPAWGSLMADLVPPHIRGRYFSTRNRIAGFITLVFSFIGGGILQFYTKDIFTGFTLLFGGASLLRLVSVYYLSRMHEPVAVNVPGERRGYLSLTRELFRTNLGRFMLLVTLIYFSANIASPFFSLYMLRDLHFSYAQYMVNISFTAVSSFMFVHFWGRRADRGGNLRVIQITAVLMPLVPINWIFSGNYFYLLGAQVVSGFAWSGFQLASTNFLYDASRPQDRTRYIALFNAMIGTAVSVGALIGGFIAPHLPALLGYNLKTLFTLSGVMRGISVLALLGGIKEVRNVRKMNTRDFFFKGDGSARKPAKHGAVTVR
jgi:MFS family permease